MSDPSFSSGGAAAPPRFDWIPPVLVFAVLASVLYGRHLGEGYLADDFLYAGWAREGAAALVAHTTVASSPQMIRPLPGLAWLLSLLPAGALLLHALSLGLHLACALLVAALVRRGRSGGDRTDRAAAWAAGVLFLVFPLFAEPVVWLSASFDLWACAFALAALYAAAAGEGSRRSIVAAAGLFLLALLSKESVVLLPFLLLLLFPARRSRPAALAMGAVAVVYVLVRLAIFGGPGGYRDAAGISQSLGAPPSQVVHALALQLPARVAMPFQSSGSVTPATAGAVLLSALLVGGLILAIGAAGNAAQGWRRDLARAARGAGVALVALAPVLPILGVDADFQGSRLLYFPVAALAVAGGLAVRRLPRRAALAAAALALYWSAAVAWNGRAWSEASREAARTIAAMRRLEARYPAGSLVFVPVHEVRRGAQVLRNGVTRAAELSGLRRDLRWFGGTVASTGGAVERLGIDLFAAGLDAAGRPRDWTACERALLPSPAALLASGELPPPPAGSVGQVVSPFARFAAPVAAVAVRLRVACRPRAATAARLAWRAVDARRFDETDALSFLVGPGAPRELVLRLPTDGRPLGGIKLALSGPAALVGCLRGYEVAAAPAICDP